MTRAIDCEIAKKRLQAWIDESEAQGFEEAARNFRDCISLLDAVPALTPPNEPLTIKQLQKMVGEPVYDYLGQEWYVIQEYYDHELTMTDGTRFFDDDEIDGVDKRFYRRPPEGEEDT